MKLGFYKVDNSLGYERHTFDYLYDDPQKIEEMLQPLLNDDNEAAIVNVEDVDSLDYFADEYNDEVYDNGYWCVLIRDYGKDIEERCKDKKVYVVSVCEYNHQDNYMDCYTEVYDNEVQAKQRVAALAKGKENCEDEIDSSDELIGGYGYVFYMKNDNIVKIKMTEKIVK